MTALSVRHRNRKRALTLPAHEPAASKQQTLSSEGPEDMIGES